MTFEQLVAFVHVAELEHLSKAAEVLRLSPSTVSASIKALEAHYNVRLFNRVGRGIELTSEGRAFMREAQDTLARMRLAEQALNEFGTLKRGAIRIQASQTIANYWLPARLMEFRAQHPAIDIHLGLGNTETVTRDVIAGAAELGFIEGTINEPTLACTTVMLDRLVIVVPRTHEATKRRTPFRTRDLLLLKWVMRERGSGTRAVFEDALREHGVEPTRLKTVLILPSNEAVLTAIRSGECATALSQAVVAPFVANGELTVLDFTLKPRAFSMVRHKERRPSAAVREFESFCLEPKTQIA